MQNEIWKDVPDYIGLYQVSNTGKIRSCSKMRGPVNLQPRILKTRPNKHGYLQITLINNKYPVFIYSQHFCILQSKIMIL